MRPTSPSSRHPLYPSERFNDRALDAETFKAISDYEEKRRAVEDAAYAAYLQKKAQKSQPTR